jgi:hypothetical protein
LFTTIDAAVAGTSTFGNTATTLAGITFANNVVKNRLSVVNVRALTAANGNIPGLDTVNVRDNIFYNFNQATTTDEYGLRVTAPGTTYTIAYSYFGNTVYPAANADRNSENVTGTGAVAIRTDVKLATFRCVTTPGLGPSTSTKLFHDYILPNAIDIRFLKGRIKFLGVNTKGEYVTNKAPMHDSMVVVLKKAINN